MRPPNPFHLFPHHHPHVLLPILLLSSLHLLTTALTLPPPPHNNSNNNNNTNNSSLSPPSHRLTAPLPHCVTNFDWIFPPFSAHDCALAAQPIALLAASFSTAPVEFAARGSLPRTAYPRFYLPARWGAGSCVVALAMLDLYPPRALPGRGMPARGESGVESDVGDWKGVFEALLRVEACVVGSVRTGWEAVGEEGGVGVFVWARKSVIDEFTRLRVGVAGGEEGGEGEGRGLGLGLGLGWGGGNGTVGGLQVA